MSIKPRSIAFAVLAACSLIACSETERNTEPLVDPWTRERTPVNFRLESQIGAATISNDWRHDDQGAVHVSLITGGLDMKKVKVAALDFEFPESEFCPKASIKVGNTIDLSSGSASFVVTAYNGEERTYTITYDQFVDPLEGTYAHVPVTGLLDAANAPKCSMILVGGWTNAYVTSTAMDKWWHWGTGYTPADEEDNLVSFMLTEVDSETGLTRGTIANLAGADGKYSNYIYNNVNDVNAFYRIIPEGGSRWAKDANGNIHIYAKDDTAYANELFVVGLLPAGTYNYFATRDIVVSDCAFSREFTVENEVVDNNWPDTRWMVDNIRRTMWTMTKTSDTPASEHSSLF